jgi:2-phospho-L-lactate transferase/gluconeogenesis factor (CofD/UPF0052 family)
VSQVNVNPMPVVVAGQKAAAGGQERLRVVMFSGGSGTRSITEYLLRHPQVDLTVLVNCYDDGHSTGRLRRFIPGMLGPSDIRKNIARMMPSTDRSHRALAALSDCRLAKKAPFEPSMRLVQAFADLRTDLIPEPLATHFNTASVQQARMIAGYCRAFLDYQESDAAEGRRFDFDDCAIGNIIFGGCFLLHGRDFNRTVAALSADYEIQGTLLNVTRGENLFLVAIDESKAVLRTEAEIVSRGGDTRIRELALVPESSFRSRIEPDGLLSDEDTIREIQASKQQPEINPEAAASLREADVIIYGPGTQHSSLLPSYLTLGAAAAIAANRSADKVFITNIRRDHDIPHDSVNDLADKLLGALRRSGMESLEWDDAVTHFFVQAAHGGDQQAYVPFDKSKFPYNPRSLRVYDWESDAGGHHGGIVFEELRQIVQSRIEISLEPLHQLLSIIVPALDEERTIEQVLGDLVQLDLSALGISKEILVVDGGSTDRTVDLAREVRGVKVLSPGRRIGRGEALRSGLKEARGGLILFYPSDNEYNVSDIPPILSQLTSGKFQAVFGTRNLLLADLKTRLDAVYSGHKGLSLVSRYGGILISTLTLLLYNRYLTDSLTSFKAFDGAVLRNLKLRSSGVDLDMEIVAKLSRQSRFILEVPVFFKPRGVEEGKKIGVRDGIAAVLALVRFRFARRDS